MREKKYVIKLSFYEITNGNLFPRNLASNYLTVVVVEAPQHQSPALLVVVDAISDYLHSTAYCDLDQIPCSCYSENNLVPADPSQPCLGSPLYHSESVQEVAVLHLVVALICASAASVAF